MKISIIITTKNEEKNIKNLLESLKIQNFEGTEVILVDNSSSDRTKEIAHEYGCAIFNFGPERSSQRNFGVKNARGKFILILDADMVLEEGVLKELYEFATTNPEYKCLTMKEEPIGNSIWARCKKLELEFYTQEKDFDLAPRWFEKKIFLDFGGFDESQTGTEDWDLPERIYLKYPKKYLTKKRVFHNEGDYGLLRILKKKFYYASRAHGYVKKTKGGIFNPKFIYILRPHFYKHWRLWFKHPLISLCLIFLLMSENFVAGMGYLSKKVKYN